jgi:hypothetical protein
MILFCDTDCLIQLFKCGRPQVLRWVRQRYGLTPMVVPEVENEVVYHLKFGLRFEKEFKQATDNGTLSVLDYQHPSSAVASLLPGEGAAAAALRAIVSTGKEYARILDEGEAHSHAASVHLGSPLLSHDRSAVETLVNCGKPTAIPVLRVFDLLVLAHKAGQLMAKSCETIRQQFYQEREWLPDEFYGTSFDKGLAHFPSRLVDAAEYEGEPPKPARYDQPLYVARRP